MEGVLNFKAKKSPGPNKLKPIIFNYLPQNTLDIINFIYRTCLKLQHSPRAWKESNVVFIPKREKPPTKKPNHFVLYH